MPLLSEDQESSWKLKGYFMEKIKRAEWLFLDVNRHHWAALQCAMKRSKYGWTQYCLSNNDYYPSHDIALQVLLHLRVGLSLPYGSRRETISNAKVASLLGDISAHTK